jgi:hypothetical protein
MSIKLKGSSDGSVSFDAPADTSPSGSDITLVLPTTVGSAEQFLKNSGTAGTLEFSSMVETSTGNVQARRARSNTAGDVALSVQQSDSTIHYGLRIDSTNNSLNLDRASGTATNLLRIDSSGLISQGGRVASNHGSPNLLLWGADSTLHITSTGSTNNSSYAGIKFAVAGGSTGDYSKAGIFVERQDSYNDLDMLFAFRSSNDATGVSPSDEKMRIDSDGKLNIGTTTATQRVSVGTSASETIGYSVDWTGAGAGQVASFTANTSTGEVRIGATNTAGTYFPTFYSNNSERMRIDSSGRVGIGVSTMSGGAGDVTIIRNSALRWADSDGTQRADIYGDSSSNIVFRNGTSSTERMRIRNDGSFRVSTDTSLGSIYNTNETIHAFENDDGNNVCLYVQHSNSSTPYGIFIHFNRAAPDNNSQYFITGQDSSAVRIRIWSDGDIDNHDNSYGSLSDVKLKQDIVDAGSQWDDLKNLRVRKFKFKSDVAAYGDEAKTLIGLVAQEAETVSPGLVKDNPDLDEHGHDLGTTTKAVRYSVLYMKAIKALQEAQTRIETLETQHADLLARITALEAA